MAKKKAAKKAAPKRKASVKSRAKKSYAKVKRTVSSNRGTSGLAMGAVVGLAVGYMIASK